MNILSSVDGDEVSPVERAANRRRIQLLKGDEMADAELEDLLAIPWEHEGAMIDLLRKEGASETVQKAMLSVVRLAKGVEDDLPEFMRETVEKLGKPLYPAEDAELQGDLENGNDHDADDVEKREFSAGARREAASTGAALPDGSYPIKDEGDLKNAIQAIGRAKDRGKAMAHIKSRAKSLGLSNLLPDKWVSKSDPEDGADTEPDTDPDDAKAKGNVKKEEAEVAEPNTVPVQKEDGSWDLSGVPDEARPVWSAVLKSNDVLAEKLQKAEERIKDQEDKLREREFIAKAEESFDVLAPASELGPILKAAADGMDEEQYKKLEELLSGATERVQKGELFKEQGTRALGDGSSTDAYSTAVKKAAELVEKGDGLSEEAAIAKVFEAHPDLYGKYLVETAGGVN